ncbi:hypothetical protein LWI29_002708 [Acer saccharum]|uniref:Uncharacterized protein n=1 Tax=Acer saccharum TaxID=4024 RepID=A0AA39S648_ACESA|nr:hypothetical protein LWI29_002708 [Acer saccharum]
MFFTFLHMFESSSPLQKPLHSESLQDIQPSNEDQHSNKNDNYGRSSVIYSSKIARGGLGGASGGKSTGSSESTGKMVEPAHLMYKVVQQSSPYMQEALQVTATRIPTVGLETVTIMASDFWP